MSRKNRPNQKPSPAAAPDPLMQPVLVKDVFATFLDVARSIGNEVQARRGFADEIGAYLAEKKLVDDFNGWRAARQKSAAPAAPAAPAND
jgi:hypothetical protein